MIRWHITSPDAVSQYLLGGFTESGSNRQQAPVIFHPKTIFTSSIFAIEKGSIESHERNIHMPEGASE